MGTPNTVFLISLGCSKNLVDGEHMLGLLTGRGFPLVSRIEEAEIAIINTCAFVQKAVEESIDTILETAKRKERGKLKRLYVVGCFVQRYGYKLRKEMPEVDGWIGTGEIHRIADILEGRGDDSPVFLIGKPRFLADHGTPKLQLTPFYSAYLKIAEGCSHCCTYCTIPRLRGSFRSRSPESLVIEAEGMVARGVKEINLVAQDTTMYGRDLEESVRLEDLLEKLLKIHGLEWIRILYSYPSRISDRLLELIATEEKICPYLDIPLQHVNREVLMAMGRPVEDETSPQLIERIRAKIPLIGLRTTLMVGFPGETDKAFKELYDFVRLARFDHLGAFIFSPEHGTPAARLSHGIEPKVAEERLDEIMRLQAEISRRKNQGLVGQVVSVLIEGLSDETDLLLKGRMATMAPDVDGQVLINKGQGMVGDIVPVLIKEAYPYDLVGEIT
ncbi:MAG: 30S ribosomal protein S12 methylthiotransferase RimO [Proteobacteria bacterium]|nr:30S ribosomal protein S12 methylthiotransferase RimO [Pseudomonadota bacterium]